MRLDLGAQLARYGNVQPSEFYKMSSVEAQAWVEAFKDLAAEEQSAASKLSFLHGDFEGRFSR